MQDIHERAFAFACQVVGLHRLLCRQGGTGRVLAGQVLRAGTAVGANLEQGKGGQSRADFIPKYSIALKEARKPSIGCGSSPPPPSPPTVSSPRAAEANELVSILTAIVKNAKARNEKGEG